MSGRRRSRRRGRSARDAAPGRRRRPRARPGSTRARARACRRSSRCRRAGSRARAGCARDQRGGSIDGGDASFHPADARLEARRRPDRSRSFSCSRSPLPALGSPACSAGCAGMRRHGLGYAQPSFGRCDQPTCSDLLGVRRRVSARSRLDDRGRPFGGRPRGRYPAADRRSSSSVVLGRSRAFDEPRRARRTEGRRARRRFCDDEASTSTIGTAHGAGPHRPRRVTPKQAATACNRLRLSEINPQRRLVEGPPWRSPGLPRPHGASTPSTKDFERRLRRPSRRPHASTPRQRT